MNYTYTYSSLRPDNEANIPCGRTLIAFDDISLRMIKDRYLNCIIIIIIIIVA